MTGSLINLVASGSDYNILTQNPNITFFKILWKQHTLFANEYLTIPIDVMNFGINTTVELLKFGDLIHDMYLEIDLPEIHIPKSLIISPSSELVLPSTSLDNYDSKYNIVNNMMSINGVAYRSAITHKNTINLSIEDYISFILNDIYSFMTSNNFLNVPTDYLNVLLGEQNLYSEPNDALHYELSSIIYILENINTIDFIVDDITVNNVFNIIQTAIDKSVLTKTYFFNKLNSLQNNNNLLSSPYANFAWVSKLGHAIIDFLQIRIGGDVFDTHNSDILEINSQVQHTLSLKKLYNEMIGNIPELTTFDNLPKPKYTLVIPLLFWFNNILGNSFPVSSLEYATLYLNAQFKPLDKCCYIDDSAELSISDIWDRCGFSLSANLIINYIFLNNTERERFIINTNEYLIQTTNMTQYTNINSIENTFNLDLYGPSKELYVLVQSQTDIDNNIWFKYSEDINPITLKLNLHGFNLWNYSSSLYNTLNSWQFHTTALINAINIISFSLFPEQYQPSGSCNFSRIKNCILNVNINKSLLTPPYIITIYNIAYNVLRCGGGTAALAFINA